MRERDLLALFSWNPNGRILNSWRDVVEVWVQPTVLGRVQDTSNRQTGLIGPGAIVAPLVALVVNIVALPQCEQEIGRLNTTGAHIWFTIAGGIGRNAELFPRSRYGLLRALFGLEVVLVLHVLIVQVEEVVGFLVGAERELLNGSLALIDVIIVVSALQSELLERIILKQSAGPLWWSLFILEKKKSIY